MNPDPTELTTELTADPTAETALDQTLVTHSSTSIPRWHPRRGPS